MAELRDVKNLGNILGRLSLLEVWHEQHQLRKKVPEQVTSCGHYPEPAQRSPAIVSSASHVGHVVTAKKWVRYY